MKTLRVCIAAASLLFVAGGALADGSIKDRRYERPFSWTGFYAGGSAGWQGSDIGLSSPGNPLTYEPRHSSFALGGFLGAQRQFGQVVVGIEGGYLKAFEEESLGATPSITIFSPGGTGTAQAKLRDIWSVGGRLGWAMGQWMPYLTGGYGNGSFQFNAQTVPGTLTEEARARTGGLYIGGGVDWALSRNWIIGVEYRHYDFGSKIDASSQSNASSELVKFDPTTDTVQARLSYKFD
jgi:outer membrane immunogenic protein